MSINYIENLIKGKITETIFDQMIREGKEFTVIPFGYEQTLPTLAQYQSLATIKDVIGNISDAPDFVLVSNNKKNVFLVEVKFRSKIENEEIYDCAVKLSKRWNPSWLFIATPNGFYFSATHNILREGHIQKLGKEWASAEMQSQFLEILNTFVKVQ